MRAILVMVLLGIGVASARAQSACDLRSEFKGSNDPAVLKILGRLKGTVAMHGVGACSGALVTFKGRPNAARALVLSAGHCANRGSVQVPLRQTSIAMLDMGEALYRAEYRRTLTLETGNSEEPRTCAEADQVVYATLTGADVMLLRLTETYEHIERRAGVKPLIVSEDTAFPEGLAVRVPSAFRQIDRACQVDVTVEKVKESRWTWGPLLRLRMDADTCIAPRGASGAPIIRTDTSEVIGLFGTSGDTTGAPCEFNNPCEVKSDGSAVAAAKNQNYVHFVHQFYSCLDTAREIDLDIPGCSLLKQR
jgi:hypothetical protein